MDYIQRPYRKYGFRQQFKPYGQYVKSMGGTTYRAATQAQRSAAARIAGAALARRGVAYPAQGSVGARAGRYGGYTVPRGFVGLAGDRKFVDTALAVYAMNTTGSITHVSIVPTGTTVNSREGKSFRVTSCQVRGNVSSDAATTVAPAAWALVWDYQPNKALPALTDIWDAVNDASFIKRENNARFKILLWRHHTMIGNVTTPASGGEQCPVDEFVKMPKDAVALCTVADTTGVIGNRINGALYLCTMGGIAAGTADANLTVSVRTNFIDVNG